MKGYENVILERRDRVLYQTVRDVEENWVWVSAKGQLRKVPKGNIQISEKNKTNKS